MQIPGYVPKGQKANPALLNPFMVDGLEYKLDMASGSRLAKEFKAPDGSIDWGSFTFSAPSHKQLNPGIGLLFTGMQKNEQ
jgi:hypothetical protein